MGLLPGIAFYHCQQKKKLETVQRSATRIVNPDLCHTYRLDFLSVPLLNYFNFSRCAKHFERLSSYRLYPIFNRINFTNLKRSARAMNVCAEISKSQKRLKGYFNIT